MKPLRWILYVILTVCLIGDISLIAMYVLNKKDVNISKRYQNYEITLKKPLVLKMNQFKVDSNRKLVVMANYDFPFELKRVNGIYDEWGIDIQFDVNGKENKQYHFSRNNYVQSGFTEQLIELDTSGASSVEIKLLNLNNVPSDKIKIRVGRKFNIDASEVEGWLGVFIGGMTILTGIVAVPLLRNKRRMSNNRQHRSSRWCLTTVEQVIENICGKCHGQKFYFKCAHQRCYACLSRTHILRNCFC